MILKKYSVFLCKITARIGVIKKKDKVGYYCIIPSRILYNKELYVSVKNGQAIYQNMEDNNIRFNNKMDNKCYRKFVSNYENQREYTKEFLESLYAN